MAALILGVGLMSLMGVWIYSFHLTRTTDEVAVAYNLAREAVERLRAMGYYYADPAKLPRWFTVDGAPLAGHQGYAAGPSARAGAKDPAIVPLGGYFLVDVTITNGSDAAAPYNLRQIDVVVIRGPDGQELFRTQTYLTQGGI